jgi:hypothetical protein
MSLICSRVRTSDGEEGASSDVGEELEEALFRGIMDHFEELINRRPCGDKNVM